MAASNPSQSQFSKEEASGNLDVNIKLNHWATKYVVLQNCVLYVFSDQQSRKEEFRIPIDEHTQINTVSLSGNRFIIKSSNQKKLSFRANSTETANQWVSALRANTFTHPSLTIDDFEIISQIGQGYYGKVRLARKRDTGEFYAIKSIHKSLLLNSNSVQSVFTERNILASCQHPFIVSLYYTFQSQTKFYLVLEFVPGGDLFRHMSTHGQLSLDEARFYIAEISLALEFLHNIGIVYRDLTPENILLDEQGHIKLTDFGLSKDLKNEKVTTTFVGTNEYLAPEIILNQEYSFPIDWWALGIIFYEMLIGYTPFYSPNRNKVFKSITEDEVPLTDDLDPLAASLIVGLLVKDPSKRFGIKEIKKHPLFDGMDWDKVEKRQLKPYFIPDPMSLANFDKNYTNEPAVDSVATPLSGSIGRIPGFSFAKMSLSPPEEIGSVISSDISQCDPEI